MNQKGVFSFSFASRNVFNGTLYFHWKKKLSFYRSSYFPSNYSENKFPNSFHFKMGLYILQKLQVVLRAFLKICFLQTSFFLWLLLFLFLTSLYYNKFITLPLNTEKKRMNSSLPHTNSASHIFHMNLEHFLFLH